MASSIDVKYYTSSIHSTKAIIVASSYQGISSSNPPKNGQAQGFVATTKTTKVSPLIVVSF